MMEVESRTLLKKSFAEIKVRCMTEKAENYGQRLFPIMVLYMSAYSMTVCRIC